MRIQEYNAPRQSTTLDYSVNVYKFGNFIKCLRYEGYSGMAMMDEVVDLKRYTYNPSDGYTLDW